MVILKIKNWP